MLLDDAQWADELSLRLLRLAARRAPELPLALVVAARPPAPGCSHAALLAERAFVRLEPAPLSAAGVGWLLAEALGRPMSVDAVARARAMTGSNPLYLSEFVHDAGGLDDDRLGERLSGDHPSGRLAAMIGDRIERLPDPATKLVRAIVVLGADANRRRARAGAARPNRRSGGGGDATR